METLLILSIIIILALIIKLAITNARMAGYEEALELVQIQMQSQANSSGVGCVGILAIIGFVATCALFFYFGSILQTI